MSVTIYNGYRLPQMTTGELNQFFLRFQKDVKQIVNKHVSRYYADALTEILNDYPFVTEETFISRYVLDNDVKTLASYQKSVFHEIYDKGRERYAKITETMRRDPEVDVGCELTIHPLEDKILLFLLTDLNGVGKLLESYENVSYYGYWDNVDPDEDCTEIEWKERKNDWNEAMPTGIPNEGGMSVTITKEFPFLLDADKDAILERIPSFEERVNKVARDIVGSALFEQLKIEEGKEEEAGNVITLMRLWRKTTDALQTEENQKRIDKEKEQVRKKLKKDLDASLFRVTFSDFANWYEGE